LEKQLRPTRAEIARLERKLEPPFEPVGAEYSISLQIVYGRIDAPDGVKNGLTRSRIRLLRLLGDPAEH
jgi:hypothetical protein